MSNEKDIELILGLNQSDTDTKITFTTQSMARYPQHLENLTHEYLISGTEESNKKLNLLANFRAEINFWCRDNCVSAYKIEDLFEPEGMRVYFSNRNDCVKFEKDKHTVPVAPMPESLKQAYKIKQ